jgi:hypothetical protein
VLVPHPQSEASGADPASTVIKITSPSADRGIYLITVRRPSRHGCNRIFMTYSHNLPTMGSMPSGRSPLLRQIFTCWNWKCALMSATARSIVYLAALARSGPRGRLSIVLVEIAYVALTAGIYAGLQQRALIIRSRLLGNITVALAVPLLAPCHRRRQYLRRRVGPLSPLRYASRCLSLRPGPLARRRFPPHPAARNRLHHRSGQACPVTVWPRRKRRRVRSGAVVRIKRQNMP